MRSTEEPKTKVSKRKQTTLRKSLGGAEKSDDDYGDFKPKKAATKTKKVPQAKAEAVSSDSDMTPVHAQNKGKAKAAPTAKRKRLAWSPFESVSKVNFDLIVLVLTWRTATRHT
jgi:hypothetical protein